MIINIKDYHDRHGYIINKVLVDFFLEDPGTKIIVNITNNWMKPEDERSISTEGMFKEIYMGTYIDNKDDCNLKIDYDGLGNFGGPYLKSVLVDIDEETLFYLKLKGL